MPAVIASPAVPYARSVAIDDGLVLISRFIEVQGQNDDFVVPEILIYSANTGEYLRSFVDPTLSDIIAATVGNEVRMDIDGDLAAIGVGDTSRFTQTFASGEVHVFRASTAELIRTIEDPDWRVGDRFGAAVAIASSRW